MLLTLAVLAAAVAAFAAISAYQNRMLAEIVGTARTEQEQAITRTSEKTMGQLLKSALIQETSLKASVADSDFAEVVRNIYTLQSLAQGIFENSGELANAAVSLPDPALNGTSSAMVLCEEGVDYTQSRMLGIAAHLSGPMIAMHRNSAKIDGLYIGLADGTDLCVDDKAAQKLDETGAPIPFPVRERPWYKGAVEAGGVYFTGIEADAFSGKLLVTCSAPVYAHGEFVGVVGIDLVLESMTGFLNTDAGEDSVVFIVNENGEVILSSARSGVFAAAGASGAGELKALGSAELSDFLDSARAHTTDLTLVTVGDRQYYLAGSPMATVGWAVVSAVDKETTEQPERQLLDEYDRINASANAAFHDGGERTIRTVIVLVAAAFLLAACAAVFAARRMVRPIEEMTRSIVLGSQTGQMFEMKDCYRTNDEIEVLAASFEDLSKKTKKYIEDITQITREKERVSTELHMAELIQQSMLPHTFPPFPDRHEFDIYASMDPAREVGGDFYDFFFIDEDHLCMVIADVSGKGVPAALFMMISKTILQSCAMLGRSVSEILNKTNEALCSNNQVEMFVTVWLGVLEISTGKLTAANAGHEYPAIRRADGSFELLRDKHGLVIGAMDGLRYDEYELRLQPGDKLFVYTDGVPEATDAENRMFGTERMLEALNEQGGAKPEQLLENVRRAVDGFVKDAEQFDDLTMMCLEYRG